MATIPDKFFGKFKLDRSENFNEYLAARGINWLLRKIISIASVTKSLEKAEEPNTYNYRNDSSSEKIAYLGFKLGVPFQGKGFDGFEHLITFDMADPETLTEKHVRVNNPDDQGTTYQYNVINDELVLVLQHDNITCRRFFKRQ